MRIDNPFERTVDTKAISCPACHAPAGQQCYRGPNHVVRGRVARWEGHLTRFARYVPPTTEEEDD